MLNYGRNEQNDVRSAFLLVTNDTSCFGTSLLPLLGESLH